MSCIGMQFGPGAMQQHGFARNLDWEISTSSADLQPDDKDPSVELTITDNDYTRAMWCGTFFPPSTIPCHMTLETGLPGATLLRGMMID